MRAAIFILYCGTAVALACRDPISPALVADLRPLDTAFVATGGGDGYYSVRLPLRLENTGFRTIELQGCGGSDRHLVFGVGGGNAGPNGYNPNWSCAGNSRILVRPGEVRIDTLLLAGPTVIHGGQPVGSLDGWMYVYYSAANNQYITSAPFLVSLPEP